MPSTPLDSALRSTTPGPPLRREKRPYEVVYSREAIVDKYQLRSELRSRAKCLIAAVDGFDQPTLGGQDRAYVVYGGSFVFGKKNQRHRASPLEETAFF